MDELPELPQIPGVENALENLGLEDFQLPPPAIPLQPDLPILPPADEIQMASPETISTVEDDEPIDDDIPTDDDISTDEDNDIEEEEEEIAPMPLQGGANGDEDYVPVDERDMGLDEEEDDLVAQIDAILQQPSAAPAEEEKEDLFDPNQQQPLSFNPGEMRQGVARAAAILNTLLPTPVSEQPIGNFNIAQVPQGSIFQQEEEQSSPRAEARPDIQRRGSGACSSYSTRFALPRFTKSTMYFKD